MNFTGFLFKKESKKPSYKTVSENGIEYKYIKKRGAKYIKISVKDSENVHITVPFLCPFEKAKDFVKANSSWIKEHLERQEFNKIDEDYKTKTDNFIITTGLTDKPVIKKTGRIVQFVYPIGRDFYSKEIQKEVKVALKKAMQIEAKEYLPKRLGELSREFNFKYNNLALKFHKTRWGSCSSYNNINLNINLMTLPDELIDYVLIHELCHTVEKNHKENFWNLVEQCMPEAKVLRHELKKRRIIV